MKCDGISLREGRGAFSLVELLVAIAIAATLLLLLVMSGSSLLDASEKARCVRNLSQLGILIMQYSADRHGDLLPAIDRNTSEDGKSGETWFQTLAREGVLPYESWHQRRESIMRCPARTSPNPRPQYGNTLPSKDYNGSHYGMLSRPGVGNLIEKGQPLHKVSAIRDPARTVMLGETDYWYYLSVSSTSYRIYPHRSGCNLLYFDGHVAFYPGELPVYTSAQQANPPIPPFF